MADTSTAPAEKLDFKTGTIHGNSGSLIIAGTINGRACDLTIDTGSDISIVRADVLSGENQEKIQPVEACLRTATGGREPLRGISQVELSIGSRKLPETLWVAGIHDQCILGLDFLHSHNCQVNLGDDCNEEEILLRRSEAMQEPSCFKVMLKEGVYLPPLSETVVSVKLMELESIRDGDPWSRQAQLSPMMTS